MMLKSGPTLLRGRTLHVPLPMLAMLSAGETAAIIGHELAHFATDTGYGMRFLPIYTGIERNLQALRSLRGASTGSWTQGPAITFWTHMMTVFDGAVKHWSRLREIEVDLAGARHSGAEMAVSALVRTLRCSPRSARCSTKPGANQAPLPWTWWPPSLRAPRRQAWVTPPLPWRNGSRIPPTATLRPANAWVRSGLSGPRRCWRRRPDPFGQMQATSLGACSMTGTASARR